MSPTRYHVVWIVIAHAVLACASTVPSGKPAPQEPTFAVIVQGPDFEAVAEAVRAVGGTITHELKIIRAVGARLTPSQRAALEKHEAVSRIYDDRRIETDGDSDDGDTAVETSRSATRQEGDWTVEHQVHPPERI